MILIILFKLRTLQSGTGYWFLIYVDSVLRGVLMEEKDYQDYMEEYKKLDKSTGSEVYWFSFDDEIAYLRERMKVIAANNQPADKKVSVAIKTMQLERRILMNYYKAFSDRNIEFR